MDAYCRFCGADTETSDCCLACSPKLQAERDEQWARVCPAIFLRTDPAQLPDQGAYRRAMAAPMARGLVMYGPTGSGKSRVAWLVARKRWEATGATVRSLNSLAGLEFASKFATGSEEAHRFVRALAGCGLLVLDDVLKSKLTDAFEAMLFALLDHRYQAQLPTIVTANDNGATIAQRLSADRSEPLLRRLRETCDSVQFRKGGAA